MTNHNIFIAHPSTTEQVEALKAFMTALKITFEVSESTSKPYNPDFVAKIKESQEEYDNGNFISVKPEDLSDFLGLSE